MNADPQLVARTLRERGPAAPAGLRVSVESALAAADRPHRGGARLRVGLAGALAAAAAALALFLPSGGNPGPTTVAIHELAGRGPTSSAPEPQRGHPQLLARNVEGVSFPNWTKKFGWRASGERTDVVGGRQTTTVYYKHTVHDIAYTIVAGKALAPPEHARHVRVRGVDLYRYRHGEHEVVVFRRGGRTCVMTGHVKHRDTVVKLATWRGDGRVRF